MPDFGFDSRGTRKLGEVLWEAAMEIVSLHDNTRHRLAEMETRIEAIERSFGRRAVGAIEKDPCQHIDDLSPDQQRLNELMDEVAKIAKRVAKIDVVDLPDRGGLNG